MGLQSYWDNYATQPSRWADPDPARCGCGGGGWWNSEVDTWHECPSHYFKVDGQFPPHPDMEEADFEGFNQKMHALFCKRAAYRHYRNGVADMDRRMDISTDFLALVLEAAGGNTPADFLEAARQIFEGVEAVFESIEYARRDADAQAAGYSCDLERRWEEDAEMERFESHY